MPSGLSDKILAGERISPEDALRLFNAPLSTLGSLAHARRQFAKASAYNNRGNQIVTYIVDRNINYTNVCTVGCRFCAFHRPPSHDQSYVITPEEMDQKVRELEAIGGTQILLQGGHHPGLTLDWYLQMLQTLRERHPRVNIHGFSPPEFIHFSRLFKMPLKEVITRFQQAGLASIPGGGAEILVDAVRARIAPRKCSTDQWLEVMAIAHELGMKTSATMMFGHVETRADRVEHLERLRRQQDATRGFSAFICWTFSPWNTPLGEGMEKAGPIDYLRTLAVARIFLDNFENVQCSWVTQGPEIGQVALEFGANDFGSVMMEENVVRSAGSHFELQKEQIERLIRQAGYEPRARNTRYELI